MNEDMARSSRYKVLLIHYKNADSITQFIFIEPDHRQSSSKAEEVETIKLEARHSSMLILYRKATPNNALDIDPISNPS
jgi:hypothetical protein